MMTTTMMVVMIARAVPPAPLPLFVTTTAPALDMMLVPHLNSHRIASRPDPTLQCEQDAALFGPEIVPHSLPSTQPFLPSRLPLRRITRRSKQEPVPCTVSTHALPPPPLQFGPCVLNKWRAGLARGRVWPSCRPPAPSCSPQGPEHPDHPEEGRRKGHVTSRRRSRRPVPTEAPWLLPVSIGFYSMLPEYSLPVCLSKLKRFSSGLSVPGGEVAGWLAGKGAQDHEHPSSCSGRREEGGREEGRDSPPASDTTPGAGAGRASQAGLPQPSLSRV